MVAISFDSENYAPWWEKKKLKEVDPTSEPDTSAWADISAQYEAATAPQDYSVPEQYYDEPVAFTPTETWTAPEDPWVLDPEEPVNGELWQDPVAYDGAQWDAGRAFDYPSTGGIGDAVGNAFDNYWWGDSFSQTPGVDFAVSEEEQAARDANSALATDNFDVWGPNQVPEPSDNYPPPAEAAPQPFDWYSAQGRFDVPEPSDYAPPPATSALAPLDSPVVDWNLDEGWGQNRFNVPEPSDIYPTTKLFERPAATSWDIPGMEPSGWADKFMGTRTPEQLVQAQDETINLRDGTSWGEFGDRLKGWAGRETSSALDMIPGVGNDTLPPDPFGLRGDSVFKNIGNRIGEALPDIANPQDRPNDLGDIFGGVRDAASSIELPDPVAPQTWDIPGMENPNTGIMGWERMSPDERGEYVWQSGLDRAAYLTDSDMAAMSPEVRFKLGYAEQERGNISNWDALKKALHPAYVAGNQIAQVAGDALWDPVNKDYVGAGLNALTDNRWNPEGDKVSDFELPLNDTASNIKNEFDITDPVRSSWDVLEAQNRDFEDRPLAEQLLLQLATGWVPGEGAPAALRKIMQANDLIQGGPAFNALTGLAPAAKTVTREVVAPAAIGGVAGAGTELAFDPQYTYTDPVTGETKTIDPSLLEMMGIGAGAFVLGKNAVGKGVFGFNTGDVEKALAKFPKTIPGNVNFAVGPTNLPVEFADPVDKAAWFATSESAKPATRTTNINRLKTLGLDDEQIALAGQAVREQVASQFDEAVTEGVIRVDPMVRTVLTPSPAVAADPSKDAAIRKLLEDNPEAGAPFSAPGAFPTPPRASVLPAGALDEVAVPSVSVSPASAPAVDPILNDILEEIDTRIAFNAATDPAARTAAWRRQIEVIKERARAEVAKRGGGRLAQEQAAMQAAKDITQEGAFPARTFDEDSLDALLETAATRVGPNDMSPQEALTQTARVIRDLQQGIDPKASELESLRAILTGTPRVRPGVDVPGAAIPGASTVPTPPTSTVDDAVPGTFRADPTRKTPARTTKPPVTNGPTVDVITGSVVDVPPPPVPVKPNPDLGGVERDFLDPNAGAFTPESRDPGTWYEDLGTTPSGAQPNHGADWEFIDPATAASDTTPQDPSDWFAEYDKPNPVREAVNKWEDEMMARGANLSPAKLEKMLNKEHKRLIDELGEESYTAAQSAKSRIPEAIKRKKATDEKFVRDTMKNTLVEEWRKRAETDFKKLDVKASGVTGKAGEVRRKLTGGLKSELADVMTLRGRDLQLGLENHGFDAKDATTIVEGELSRYLDKRFHNELMRGDPDALLNRAYTAIHLGDFNPATPARINKVETGTGEVSGFLKGTRKVNAELKNMMFGITDAAALFGNGMAAVAQGVPITVAYANRLLEHFGKGLDLTEARKFQEVSGLLTSPKAQDAVDPGAGTLVGHLGRGIKNAGAESLGDAFIALDQIPTAFNKALEKYQFDLFLNKGVRKPAYEGNLILMHMLSKIPGMGSLNIASPTVQRAAARMANAASSAAPLARGQSRQAFEASFLNTARFTRAQGDLLAMSARIFGPNTPLAERVIAAQSIFAMAGAMGLAYTLAGGNLNLDWQNPKDFGRLTIPNGQGGHMTFSLLPQKQIARTLALSADTMYEFLADGKNPTEGLRDAWSQFLIGRSGPLASLPMKGAGIGFDPQQVKWMYPGEDGAWGADMSITDRIIEMAPLPSNMVSIIRNARNGQDASLASIITNTFGLSAYDVNAQDEAFHDDLAKGAFKDRNGKAITPQSMDDLTTTQRRQFHARHPELIFEGGENIDAIMDTKAQIAKDFESSSKTVGNFRKEMEAENNKLAGVFMEIETGDPKARPEKLVDQWIYDYNQTFAKSAEKYKDQPNTEEENEYLGQLQAEFWKTHKDPAVRLEILDYQKAGKSTLAERMYVDDLARLAGFDPKTGKELMYPNSTEPMPSYFEMPRYKSRVLDNDTVREFLDGKDGFAQWQADMMADYPAFKNVKPEQRLREFMKTQSMAPNGEPWTEAARLDILDYGDESAETPQYKAYKALMAPELAWMKPDLRWSTVAKLHRNREWK